MSGLGPRRSSSESSALVVSQPPPSTASWGLASSACPDWPRPSWVRPRSSPIWCARCSWASSASASRRWGVASLTLAGCTPTSARHSARWPAASQARSSGLRTRSCRRRLWPTLLMDTGAVMIPALGGGVWRVIGLVTLYAGLAAVNIRGARSGARLSMIMAVVKIAPLVLLVIAGAFAVHPANLQWGAGPHRRSSGRRRCSCSLRSWASRVH